MIRRLIVAAFLFLTTPVFAQQGVVIGPIPPCSAFGTTVGTCAQSGAAGSFTTLNATGALTFSGNGTFAAGTISKNATYGILVGAATGSTNDFALVTPGGVDILTVPTGTTGVKLSGNFTVLGSASIGALTASAQTTILQNTDWVFGATGTALYIQKSASSGNTNVDLQSYTSGANSTGVLRLNPNGGAVSVGSGGLSVTGGTTLTATGTVASINTVNGGSFVSIAASGNAQVVLNSSAQLIMIREATSTGAVLIALANSGGTAVSIITQAGWTINSTTPAGATYSLGYDGTVYRIYNGTGATRIFYFATWAFG